MEGKKESKKEGRKIRKMQMKKKDEKTEIKQNFLHLRYEFYGVQATDSKIIH